MFRIGVFVMVDLSLVIHIYLGFIEIALHKKKNTVFIHCARLIAKYALRMDAWNINPVLSRSWPKFSSRLSRHSWYTRREGQQLQREEQLTFGWRWLMAYNQVWFSAGNQVEAWKPPTGLHEPGWTIWTKGNAYNPFTEIANCSLGEYSFSVIWIIQYESYQLSSHVRILGRRLMHAAFWRIPGCHFFVSPEPAHPFCLIWFDMTLNLWNGGLPGDLQKRIYEVSMQNADLLNPTSTKRQAFQSVAGMSQSPQSWSDVDVSAWYGPYRFHSTCLPFVCLKR